MEQGQDFSFRPMRPGDREAVMAICAKIWDGDDYLPASFDAWLADEEGTFTACLHGGRIVGLGKTSFTAPGHAWLEGLRKDPDAGVKGVGRALCLQALRSLAVRPGLRSIRFSTYFANAESRALNERIGFRQAASFSTRAKRLEGEDAVPGLDPSACGPYGVRPATDRDRAWGRLRAAGWFERFLCASWKAFPADGPETLASFAPDAGLFEAAGQDGATAGTLVLSLDRTKRQANVAAMEADSDMAAAALLLHAEKACLAAGFPYVEAICPPVRSLLDRFAACGYASWEREDDFLLYEFPMERLAEFAPGA